VTYSDSLLRSSTPEYYGSDTTNYGLLAGEACPMQIRGAVFQCISVDQTSSYPCAEMKSLEFVLTDTALLYAFGS